jgi:hypothetical protein
MFFYSLHVMTMFVSSHLSVLFAAGVVRQESGLGWAVTRHAECACMTD